MPTLFRFIVTLGLLAGAGLWRDVCAGHSGRAEQGRDDRAHSVRKNQSAEIGCRMNSAAQIEAFLEMMSAERGAADNTLASYRRDLDDAASAIAGGLADAASSDIRAYPRRSGGAGLRRLVAGAQAVGAAAVLQVPLRRRPARRRPDRHARQPAARPAAAQDDGRGRDRPPARPRRAGGGRREPRGRRPRRRQAPARAGRGALRHRPARLRTGRPAA